MNAVRRALLGAAALLLALTGCDVIDPGSEAVEPTPTMQPRELSTYAALGDSYSAGPFIPVTELDSGCFRSTGNYPNLVAEALDVDELRDVTCGAAETVHVTERQRTVEGSRVEPQIEALDEDVDLVTIGIGGNDFGLFTSGVSGDSDLSVITRIGHRLIDTLERVQEAAPNAIIILVGYPRLIDEGSTCTRLLPFTPGQVAAAEVLQRELNLEMINAADRVGVEYVDLYAYSEGHGICSERPWVNGQTTRRGVALAYHPLERGMRAAAALVVEAVEEAREAREAARR